MKVSACNRVSIDLQIYNQQIQKLSLGSKQMGASSFQ